MQKNSSLTEVYLLSAPVSPDPASEGMLSPVRPAPLSDPAGMHSLPQMQRRSPPPHMAQPQTPDRRFRAAVPSVSGNIPSHPSPQHSEAASPQLHSPALPESHTHTNRGWQPEGRPFRPPSPQNTAVSHIRMDSSRYRYDGYFSEPPQTQNPPYASMYAVPSEKSHEPGDPSPDCRW